MSIALDKRIAKAEHLGVKVYLRLVQKVWQVDLDVSLDDIYQRAKASNLKYFKPFLSNQASQNQLPVTKVNEYSESDDEQLERAINAMAAEIAMFFIDEEKSCRERSILFCEISTLKMETLMRWRYGH